MDTVTHAMTGLIASAPFAVSHPLAAGCIAIGSVLPDLDALSRIGGKLSFLRWHQTISHGVFAIASYAVIGMVLVLLINQGPWYAGLGLAAGAALHVLLDLTNTYGLGLFSPVSERRFCLEWVFFVDAVFILACIGCLVLLGLDLTQTGLMNATAIVLWFALFSSAYWAVRAVLRRIAIHRSGHRPVAMMPSALWPWVWYGYAHDGGSAQLIQVNLLRRIETETVQTFDEQYASVLAQSDAYRVMRGLSIGYHATDIETSNEETIIRCRDLRVRNFGGTFGNLEITVDAAGDIISEVLHV